MFAQPSSAPRRSPPGCRSSTRKWLLSPLCALPATCPCQTASLGPAGTRSLQEQLEISSKMARSPLPGFIHCQTLLWYPALGGNSLALPSAKGTPSRDPLLRGLGGVKGPSSGSRQREERTREGRACREQAPSCPKTLSLTLLLPAKPQSLDPPALSPHRSSIGEQDRKAAPQKHTQPGEQQDNPLLSPGAPTFPWLIPKEGPPSGMERHPHYPRAARSHASTQIASLNVVALSQFHEFNIVPGLLFA